MGAVAQLVRSLSAIVPFPVLMGIVTICVILAIPGLMRNAHTRQIRTGVRDVARATSQDLRGSREDAAIELTRRDPHLLFVLADEALRLNQRRLAERALTELAATGKLPAEVDRLRRALAPELPKSSGAAIEALVQIRALHKEGLVTQARQKLADARAQFPDDEGLAELERSIT